MRRTLLALAAAALLLGPLFPSSAEAQLYKGSGRRSPQSQDPPWQIRLNLSGGAHGAFTALHRNPLVLAPEDGYPYPDDRWSDWQFGGYLSAGLEFLSGENFSLEPYAHFRRMEREGLVKRIPLAGVGLRTLTNQETEAYGVGLTLRGYQFFRGGAGYVGLGGGYVHGEAVWLDHDGLGLVGETQDTGEIHALLGLDLHLGEVLAVGFEAGWRWSDLEGLNEFEGAFIGARAGLLFGGGR